ncbi:MAG: AAA family ATPase [Magnetovibrio sp.]|nr:AAA family ATPase [Magnetovibrio sp.]|tara:strand:+ start:888 stop:1742 length:855 start_codon:yes stop_codon:yes gene_type:complete
MIEKDLKLLLERITSALERIAPPINTGGNIEVGDAFIWQSEKAILEPVVKVQRIDLSLLKGIDHQREILLSNTTNFANGLPANNALLWGARGSGKSSLVKAAHAYVNQQVSSPLVLIEIYREEISSLPKLLAILRKTKRRCLLFCDDLSFESEDANYKSLKAVLDGGIEGRPENVIFYATSNRRHLMPRNMIENESANAITPSEAVEEKVSLSDRFGLWLGFYNCDQRTYLDMVENYVKFYGLKIERDNLHSQASEWAVTRGSRSGRSAWQFLQHLAGQLGKKL